MLAFKSVFLFVFVFATLTVFALMPMNVSSAPEQAPELQETVVPVTVVAASPVPTSYSIPVTGAPTMSTILIIGLLIIVGVAIIVGGLALTSKNNNNSPR